MLIQGLLEVLLFILNIILLPIDLFVKILAPFLNGFHWFADVVKFFTYGLTVGLSIFGFLLGSNVIAGVFIVFMLLSLPIKIMASLGWTIYSRLPIIGKGK